MNQTKHTKADQNHPDERAAVSSLRSAMRSLYGYAPFALLTEIHRIASAQFGFTGSVEEAARLLHSEGDIRVERDPASLEHRVYSAMWSPRQIAP